MTDVLPDDGSVSDETVPQSARIWNYWLGGSDHSRVDREAGDEFLTIFPEQRDKALACRAFQTRAIRHLAAEAGVRQFLDIGAGLLTADSTHAVAQQAFPDARVVYVDVNPLVVGPARAGLTSTPEGATAYLEGDLRDPDAVLAGAGATIDLDRPVALLIIGVLGHVEYAEARTAVPQYLERLVPGSYFVQCDGTDTSAAYLAAVEHYRDSGGEPYNARTPDQIAAFYAGLDVVEPGVGPIQRWRVNDDAPDLAEVGGVGRKP